MSIIDFRERREKRLGTILKDCPECKKLTAPRQDCSTCDGRGVIELVIKDIGDCV